MKSFRKKKKSISKDDIINHLMFVSDGNISGGTLHLNPMDAQDALNELIKFLLDEEWLENESKHYTQKQINTKAVLEILLRYRKKRC